MSGLAAIIEFFADALADFLRHFPRVDDRIDAPVQREHDVELAQIGLHDRLHVGILQFARKAGPSLAAAR